MKLSWIVALGALVTCCCISCADRGRQVKVMIPDGFRGVFQIVPDKTAAPVRSDGTPTFIIPTNGICRTADTGILEGWNALKIVTYAGKEIPIASSADENAVSVRPLGFDDQGRCYFCVGTQSECRMAAHGRLSDLRIGSVISGQ